MVDSEKTPENKVLGHRHIRAVNFMTIVPENRTIKSEGGTVLAVRVLGTVVSTNIPPNTSSSGDESTLSVSSHGGITDPPYDSEVPGTIIRHAENNNR